MFRQTNGGRDNRGIVALYKNAYSGLSRPIWMQATVMLINRAGTMVVPFLTIYLNTALHFSIAKSGAVLSIYGAGAILGVYVGGKLTDRIGFFPVQFWSLLLNGVLFLVLWRLRGFTEICACIFLLSSIGEAFRPANASATAYYSKPENRTRSYSLNRLAVNIGFAVGPALGGFLAALSYGWLFWTDGCTCIIAAMFLWWQLKPRASGAKGEVEVTPHAAAAEPPGATGVAAEPGGAAEASEEGPVRSPYRDKVFLRFIFLVWIYAIGFFQIFSVIPLYYERVIRLNNVQVGLLFSMNGILIALLEMVLVYRLENKKPNSVYISYGVLIHAAAFAVLLICPALAWVAVFHMLLMTAAEMTSVPFMNSYFVGRSHEQTRGQYAALYGMAFSAAQVVGPSLGAQVAGFWGFRWLWGILMVVALVNYLGFRRLTVSERS